jgi:hypothetical protein
MKPAHELSDDELGQLLCDEARQTDAPEHVIQRALRLYRRRRPQARPGVLDRIVALLTFDSAAGSPLALGVRSTAATAARQMLFSAEGRDIDLRIASAGLERGFDVSGQVLGPDLAGVVTLEGGGGRWSTELNDLAEFSFGTVPPGHYTLTLHLEGAIVVLPALQLDRAR